METKKNEFEELEEDFPEPTATPVENSEIIADSRAGLVYDWSNAPDTVKAPPRISLNGKTVTLLKAEIILPDKSKPWDKTRDKSKDVKYCTFKLFYSEGGQQEFLSGIRVFKTETSGKEMYSHPSITKDGKNQASALMVKYAKYKNKDINEVSLKEFMNFLNSKPQVLLISEEVINPKNGEKVIKNMVDKFI